MDILSLHFYINIFIGFVFYWLFPSKYRWTVLLALTSFFIYYGNNADAKLILIVLALFTITWGSAIVMGKYTNEKIRGFVLITSLLVDIGCLIWLKDINFFVNIFNFLGGNHQLLSFIAPIGISYFVLSLVGYTLDVYWGQVHAEKNFFKFLLFFGYFPLLVFGPIVRYSETGQELFAEKKITYENFCFGCQRILWGFFKKLVIAERASVFVSTIYGDLAAYNGLYALLAMAFFVLQMYTDFSGGIDIVMGVSQIFGVSLPENFDLPFASTTLAEFWRRWHITLGTWLKNYVFYPILRSPLWINMGKATKKRFGKKWGKRVPTWLGLFVSWFLIGFWHGGGWNFIIGVGLFQWLIIVLEDLLEPQFKKIIAFFRMRTETFSWKLFQCIRTTIFYMIGLSMFRCYSGMSQVIELYKSLFSIFNPWVLFDGSLMTLGLSAEDYRILCLSFLIIAVAGVIRIYQKESLRIWMSNQIIAFRWITWIGLFLITLIWGKYGPNYTAAEFIYRGF